jgi:N-methylhydantoinase A
MNSRLAVGIDVGGTFTDLAAVDADGAVHARKTLTTPGDQSEGVARSLELLGVPAAEVHRIVHGTTVATNALLERTGARVALCATAGATDLLELRRQERASLYDLAAHHPAPLVHPSDVVAVDERIAPEGVLRELSPGELQRVAEQVSTLGAEAVAISLLHAYADPRHEHAVAEVLRDRLPQVDVVLSSDVLPEVREYERTSTTVAEAYLRPRVAGYLSRLVRRLADAGYPAPGVMTSGGGMRDAASAARSAASFALSGPAGGVVGTALVARAAGFADALGVDIGGTSADVGLVLNGQPLVEPGGPIAGVPISLPRVLVETVSAGGGSVGRLDDGGALRAGPRSAGARPGPAAFGLGGIDATVTDAHVVLGHIRAARIAGGVGIDAHAAHAAVERLATALGESVERVARAMLAVADAAMSRAMRRVSVERGVDPRRCVLVAFGGGGPLHGCALAELAGMRTVLVPPHAGVLSALGLAVSPERREAMASVMRSASDLGAEAIGELCDDLDARCGTLEQRERWVRARYAGQGHEMDVPISPGDDGEAIAHRFAALHAERVGFTLDRFVELVSARATASGEALDARLARRGRSSFSAANPVDEGGELEATVRGPANIALPDATLLVREGWTARALPIGGWLLERDA